MDLDPLFSARIKADNGCLGHVCRGRTHKAAIFVGEEPYSSDPAVSEWRNPPAFSGECIVKTIRILFIKDDIFKFKI